MVRTREVTGPRTHWHIHEPISYPNPHFRKSWHTETWRQYLPQLQYNFFFPRLYSYMWLACFLYPLSLDTFLENKKKVVLFLKQLTWFSHDTYSNSSLNRMTRSYCSKILCLEYPVQNSRYTVLSKRFLLLLTFQAERPFLVQKHSIYQIWDDSVKHNACLN